MANSIFNGRAHPEGGNHENRRQADEEYAKRRDDCQQQVRADHDEVFKNMRDHLDRLRNGGK